MSYILIKRQKTIINSLIFGKTQGLQEIMKNTDTSVSLATIKRDIQSLEDLGYIKQKGEKKGSVYELTPYGLIMNPIDSVEYSHTPVDLRKGNTSYTFDIWNIFSDSLFTSEDVQKLETFTCEFVQKSIGASELIHKKELERFVVELSWKSSSIEGNTYTLLETEALLIDGLRAQGKTEHEAQMILNHKSAFTYIMEHKHIFKHISKKDIVDVHRLLTENLGISYGFRNIGVGITGSTYKPLALSSQIEEAIEHLCMRVNCIKDAYSKALTLLVGLSYIQPFEDGNKRTARLITNAVLMAYDKAPLSYRNVDEVLYRESMLIFYERNSIYPMLHMFVEQYVFACGVYMKF